MVKASICHYDLLDIATVKGIYCLVHVYVISELSSDHCLICVHLATQHTNIRDEWWIVEWKLFGLAFCSHLPKQVLLRTLQQVDKAMALFNMDVVSAVDVFSRMKPGLTSDYQHIPAKVTMLTRERNRLQRCWQRVCEQSDKAVFNRMTGKLYHDMLVFHRCS